MLAYYKSVHQVKEALHHLTYDIQPGGEPNQWHHVIYIFCRSADRLVFLTLHNVN